MVVTGLCMRMNASEMRCSDKQTMDDRTRVNRSLQTSCHDQVNSRLAVENEAVRQVYLENRNLSEIDQETAVDNEAAGNEAMTSASCENGAANPQRMEGHYFGTKGDMVFSLLSVLGTHNKEDMSRTLLAMSTSFESCVAMRQSGCLPLLIHLLHGGENNASNMVMRSQAAAALHNIVHVHCEDQRGRQEARVLRLLEQIRGYCDYLRMPNNHPSALDHLANSHYSGPSDYYPGPAVAALMKLSFDEEHRHAVCTLGGVQAIAELLQMDHDINGSTTNQYHITMRRYACMALTNLTFGDGTNKALLCSMVPALKALVQQLESSNEDLCQVAASVLRNLSWHADFTSKRILRDVGAVPRLMGAALGAKKESTLKSLLSALWNFSSHCIENKADICETDGALQFLIKNLTYRSPLKTLSIIENCGGILRNVSSHIAVREDYRAILRQNGCLQILLKHLRSPSLTVVSNACGTLWNLSARCAEDQRLLLDLGAVNMLKNLVHSKHKMISMGSAAALKNLLSAMPTLQNGLSGTESTLSLSGSKSDTPGLHMRRQRALESELEQQNLTETCENMESPQGSPTESPKMEVHAKARNNQTMMSLVGSSSRMSSSLRGHLPVDPVHGLCHHRNQGFSSLMNSSFDGGTAEKKRVNEMLHKRSQIFPDRQSPVTSDSFPVGVKDVARIAGVGGFDVMSGSHSQFQDVKMMHSFSSYCEPTASTSPETSPTPRRATSMASGSLFQPFHGSLHLANLREESEKNEESMFPTSAGSFAESRASSEGSTPASGLSEVTRRHFVGRFESQGEDDLPCSANSFTENRLSLACSENIYTFDSENSPVLQPSSVGLNFLNKEASNVEHDRVNLNILLQGNSVDDTNNVSRQESSDVGGVNVFNFENIQSGISEQHFVGVDQSGVDDAANACGPFKERNHEFSGAGYEQHETESIENFNLDIYDIVSNQSNVHKFPRSDENHAIPKAEYMEKFFRSRFSSGEEESEPVSVSTNPASCGDMFELKLDVNPDFRRLSSSGSHGEESQDDDEAVADLDDVVIQSPPPALDGFAHGDGEDDDDDDYSNEVSEDVCAGNVVREGDRLFQVLQNEVLPVSGDLFVESIISPSKNCNLQAEIPDEMSFPLPPKEFMTGSLELGDSDDDGNPLQQLNISSDKSKDDVLQLEDVHENTSLALKGFVVDCCPAFDVTQNAEPFYSEGRAVERKEFSKSAELIAEENYDDFVLVNVDHSKDGEQFRGESFGKSTVEPSNSCGVRLPDADFLSSLKSVSESVVDIMNESFPDLSSSLISEMTTSHEDFLAPERTDVEKPVHPPSEKSHFESVQISRERETRGGATGPHGRLEKDEDFKEPPKIPCNDFSAEQERALEENANIILSELERRSMLESSSSEMHLLQYETLSLVSNDDEEDPLVDDSASEASCDASLNSVAISERSSCTSHTATITTRPVGPRIVKPGSREIPSLPDQDDSSNASKGIRGRRKLLFSKGNNRQSAPEPSPVKPVSGNSSVANKPVVRKPVSTAPPSKSPARPNTTKPVVIPGAKKPVQKSNSQLNNAVPVENSRQPVVRVNRATNLSSANQAKPRAPSVPSERKPLTVSRQIKSAPPRSKSAAASERHEGSREPVRRPFAASSERIKPSVSAADKSRGNFDSDSVNVPPETDESLDRPKPPIKQDTFVKDTPSFSVAAADSREERREGQGRKQRDKESDQVSRSSVESAVSSVSTSVRRPAPSSAPSGSTRQARRAMDPEVVPGKSRLTEAQIGRHQTAYSGGLSTKPITRGSHSNGENAAKMSTFNKKPASASNASDVGSCSSLSSVGKTPRSGVSSGVSQSSGAKTQALGGRPASSSTTTKPARSEKLTQDVTFRKAKAIPTRPQTCKTEKAITTIQQKMGEGSVARQPTVNRGQQPDVKAHVQGACTLTRSSTYDKLTDDDPRPAAEPISEGVDGEESDEDASEAVEAQTKPPEVDPRRLTRVVESTLRLGHLQSNVDDENNVKNEPYQAPKSQDRAELTLELDPEVSITDPIRHGRSITLERSTMLPSQLFEKHLGENELNQLLTSKSTKTSHTLPRSLFSPLASSARTTLSDDGDLKSGRKLSVSKEGRKLGFGLWKRNNAASKTKPTDEEKAQRPGDTKAGSPVHKVFGWFRKAGDGGKKTSKSKIPGPESGKSGDAFQTENGNLKTADSGSTRKTDNFGKELLNFSAAERRQIGQPSARGNSPLRAAIVQPFNYRPVARTGGVATEVQKEPSGEPMTKTEMLLARRRQSRAVTGGRDSILSQDGLKPGIAEQTKKSQNVSAGGKDQKSPFLVTSV